MKDLMLKIENLLQEEKERKQKKWREKVTKKIEARREKPQRLQMELFNLHYAKHIALGRHDALGALLGEELKSSVEQLENEDKYWLVEKLKEELTNQKEEHISLFYNTIGRKVLKKTSRLKMITEGKGITDYLFVEEEDLEKVREKMRSLMVLHLKKQLDLPEENLVLEFMKNLSWLYESPIVKEFDFLSLIEEEMLEDFCKEDELKETKAYLKKWYQTLKDKPDLINLDKNGLEEIKKYHYLLTNEDVRGLKKKYEKVLEKKYKAIDESKHLAYATPIHDLLSLKEEIKKMEIFFS